LKISQKQFSGAFRTLIKLEQIAVEIYRVFDILYKQIYSIFL